MGQSTTNHDRFLMPGRFYPGGSEIRCRNMVTVEANGFRRLYIWIWATTSTYRSYAGKFYPAFKIDAVHVTQQPTDSRGGVELGLPTRLYIWIWAITSTYRSYAGKFYPAFGTDTVHVPLQPTDSRGGVELGLPFPVESSPIEETISGKHRQGCIYGYGQPHQHIDLMPVSSIRCSKWMPYTLRCSQRIHEVAWNLAYRRHNSEFPVESSPIEATISGIHIQGCIFGYRQLHQHIDLIALIFTWHAEYEGCPFRDITVTMVARTFLYNSITRFGVPAK
ncbi:conserved hypothetical protein [Trichinella spiralis]|uniref:hypothetical protein n=1 Tax=Trichinella spiralis TaxID=6334 RepID=UPI0001EFE696|nr:conserved hypothetical protein [Trichinella spiralis]